MVPASSAPKGDSEGGGIAVAHGRCLCGGVQLEAEGTPLSIAHCHCRMCQRSSGAPAVTWATFRPAQVHLRGPGLKYHASSPFARRGFCADCGASVSWETTEGAAYVDLCVALFDEPQRFAPTHAIWTSSRVDWLQLDTHLPQYPERGPSAGD